MASDVLSNFPFRHTVGERTGMESGELGSSIVWWATYPATTRRVLCVTSCFLFSRRGRMAGCHLLPETSPQHGEKHERHQWQHRSSNSSYHFCIEASQAKSPVISACAAYCYLSGSHPSGSSALLLAPVSYHCLTISSCRRREASQALRGFVCAWRNS